VTLYENYVSAAGVWRWPNFTPKEIACQGTGSLLVNTPALNRLQLLRDLLGIPLTVLSAYRSPRHNALVGGAPLSQHLDGAAFDLSLVLPQREMREAAADVGFTGFGGYRSFIHIDIGRERSWGKWTF
jgi:uncharacterized protein YcbK (DUF882 family)